MSKQYEYVYFDVRGRGEPMRLAFHAAGVKFEDQRVTRDSWPQEKPKAPQGRLPYLIIYEGGKGAKGGREIKLSHSQAILRHIGREYGMYGAKGEEIFVDEVVETCVDLFELWVREYAFCKDEDVKKKFKPERVPTFYEMLEKCVAANGKNGFAVGNKLTIADCMLYNVVELCGEENLDKYKHLEANRKKVTEDKNIAAYLKVRKQTDM